MKVQRLLEELRTVKATDAARINELKKELATLRSVMRNYIIQIDSLNSLNKKLMEENKSVTSKYQAVAQTASQLQKDKEQLSHKVTLCNQNWMQSESRLHRSIKEARKPTKSVKSNK